MKVFFVIDSLANAGTEKSLLDIVSHFSSKINATVFYIHKPETLKQQYYNAGIDTIKIAENSTFFSNAVSLINFLKKEKPDVVVSSLFKSNILCRICCLITRKKLIGTFVSDSYSKMRTKEYSIKKKIGHTFFWQIDKITSIIPLKYISNSSSIKLSNCKALQINKEKVKVIYRGRDSDRIHQWKKPVNDQFIFIIIARILKTKGFDELFEALSIILKEHRNIQLHIYGDGNYEGSLKAKIQKLDFSDKVIFKGNIINAHQYLLTANCFVFPSWYEGLSGALIEAAISGIPIIASNISMNKEVINSLPTAIMHKVKNAESLAQCMQEMINNYHEYSKNTIITRSKAIEKFDIKNISLKYENFLLSI